MEELNFKCGNPGAVQFGNFINYYQFHPPDNRIAMLPQNIWNFTLQKPNKCYVLDVGCNAGVCNNYLRVIYIKCTFFRI